MTEQFLEWDAFSDRLPTLTQRIAIRMAARGEFPKPIRLSPRTPALWKWSAVQSWIENRLGATEVTA